MTSQRHQSCSGNGHVGASTLGILWGSMGVPPVYYNWTILNFTNPPFFLCEEVSCCRLMYFWECVLKQQWHTPNITKMRFLDQREHVFVCVFTWVEFGSAKPHKPAPLEYGCHCAMFDERMHQMSLHAVLWFAVSWWENIVLSVLFARRKMALFGGFLPSNCSFQLTGRRESLPCLCDLAWLKFSRHEGYKSKNSWCECMCVCMVTHFVRAHAHRCRWYIVIINLWSMECPSGWGMGMGVGSSPNPSAFLNS